MKACAVLAIALLVAAGLYAEDPAIEDGTAKNGVTYCLRRPAKYDPKKGAPAIVILHGSNMNSKDYVRTIVEAWPKLAEAYVLIGVNGENRVKDSPDDHPAYNYTYVDFVGKSRYRGYPGTDRESPALVSEVIQEIQTEIKLTKVFVGGHSQGGFLAYSLFLNYPGLFAGAFPISAGLIMQCEPTAFEDADLRARQRSIAVAILHGENDPAVDFAMGRAAYESFEDDGFPRLRLFADPRAGHMFGRLPVDQAIEWLEASTSDNPAALLDFAAARAAAGEYRDATAALLRSRELDTENRLAKKRKPIEDKIKKEAAPKAKELAAAIAAAKDGSWVEEFLQFRAKFEFADGATDVMAAYRALRARHEGPAEKLWGEARQAWQDGREEEAIGKCREIVEKHFASSFYRYARQALEGR